MAQNVQLQVPGNGGAVLLQTLTDLSISATSGGGVFAWATSHGVRALLESPDFEGFLQRYPFHLIVGTDAITDVAAVEALIVASDYYPRLRVRAVLNDSRSLFHPKIAWFKSAEETKLIVGSGNLTRGGLIGNWEAYSVITLDTDAAADLLPSLDDWLASLSPGIVDIRDPRVLDRARKNEGDENSLKRSTSTATGPDLADVDFSGWLVAELNKSRKNSLGESLFSQASFDGDTFRTFFEFSGAEVDVILSHVNADGSLDAIESRKGRYKAASVNYYFELGSVKGIPYPTVGRPVAVFGRLASGGYLYRVALPGDSGHAELSALLAKTAGRVPPARMRRATVSYEVMEKAWPGNPMLTAVSPSS